MLILSILLKGSTLWDFVSLIEVQSYHLFFALGFIFLLFAILKETKFWKKDETVDNRIPFSISIICFSISIFSYFQSTSSTTLHYRDVRKIRILSCIKNDETRIDDIKSLLKNYSPEISYSLPPASAIENNPYSSFRYFHHSNKKTAENLTKYLNENLNFNITARDMTLFYSTERQVELKNRFEIWLSE